MLIGILGLLPIIAITALLVDRTMQQQSALAFGVNIKNTHFYDVFNTTQNGVEKFAAD